MKNRQGMTSGECVENKWFNKKYIRKYLSVEINLTHECMMFIKIMPVAILNKKPEENRKSCYMIIENCDVENLSLCLNHKCL
jgi:hypothetical protein